MESRRSDEMYRNLRKEVERSAAGALLPSVSQMKRRWKVGQGTLMNALARLEQEGRIERRRRVGILVGSSAPGSEKPESQRVREAFSPWLRTSSPALSCLVSSIEEKVLWDELSEAFQQHFPRLRVTVEFASDAEILRRLAAPERPTLVELCSGPHFYRPLFDGSLFQDLSAFLPSLGSLSRYEDSAFIRDARGRLVGIVPFLVTEVVLANRALFKDAGVEILVESGHWDPFVALLQSVRRALRRDDLWGHLFFGFTPFFVQWGVLFLDSETGKIRLNTPEMREAMRFLQKLIVEDRLAPFPSELLRRSHPFQDFVEGRSLTLQCYSYSLQLSPDRKTLSGLDLACMAPPMSDRGRRLVSGPVLCLDAASGLYEEGWQLIQFLLSEEGQRIAAGHRCYVPVLKSVVPSASCPEGFQEYRLNLQHALRESASPARMPFLECPDLLRVAGIIEATVDRWLKFGGDPGQTLDQAEEVCQESLAKSSMFAG
ncbi:MAG: GntR family transcriptional regulator [Planctomycetes bacterium]|nr:GntR family transcriptional regulator [Planctomycetota bacterium]